MTPRDIQLYHSSLAPWAVYAKYSSPAHLEAAPFLTHFVRNVIRYVPTRLPAA